MLHFRIVIFFLVFVLLIPAIANAQEFPDWLSQVKQWVNENLITQQEFNQVIEYLIEKEILHESNQIDYKDCLDLDNIILHTTPIEISSIQMITPMGRVSDSHVTPTDHQYWAVKGGINQDHTLNKSIRVDLRSPADGYVTDLEYFRANDYRMVIQHSCSFSSYYIHVAELSEKILNDAKFSDSNKHQYTTVHIPITQGEIIGKVTGPSFDFSVVDEKVFLEGFVSYDRYNGEPWKIHTVDPFDYFEESISSQLIEKTIRNIHPIGGKIDYDIEGRLVGNWFKLDSSYRTGQENYWIDHLSVVYDHIDPSQIRISFGDFDGKSKQFGIKGNSPDPESVSIQDGLIKYELVPFDYFINSNQYWDRMTPEKNITSKNLEDNIQGVVLLQILDDSKLKVEIFPGKSATQVSDFTANSEIYDR